MLAPSTHKPAQSSADRAPVMCVVVDTEEEFDWSKPFSRDNTSTSNILAQHLAHERVYDGLGIVPTYVIDWPVATTATAWAALKGLMDSGRCDIGTHLHPWVSPPHREEVNVFNSYTGNLPPELEFDKLKLLTEAIEANFQRRPTIFKAGRYGLGPKTHDALMALGYRVDASVVPHTSFQADGGPDFRSFTNTPFWFGSGDAALLELPVTTGYCGLLRRFGAPLHGAFQSAWGRTLRLGGIAARSGMLERIRLTPEGCTAQDLIRLTRTLVADQCKVLTLTYHSSSLAPGNTPYVRTSAELDAFLRTIQQVCRHFKEVLGGRFLSVSEVADELKSQRA